MRYFYSPIGALVCVLLSACSLLPSKSGAPVTVDNTPVSNVVSGNIDIPSKREMPQEMSGATTRTSIEKVKEAKKRKNFRSIIRKGDYFLLKEDKDTALRYYLNAYMRLKSDVVLEKKIANTYFELKDYANALVYFKKVAFGDLSEQERDKMLMCLLFIDPLPNRSLEIRLLPLGSDDFLYYDLIDTCYTGIHNCVVAIESASGANSKILSLKDAVANASKISTDIQFRNASLAGKFMEQKQYLAAAKIGTEIIEKRPNYFSVLKLTGSAFFEYGDYKSANLYFQKYFRFEPKDLTTAYLLGIVNYYLEDYAMSNLYFNNAVINGYSPKTELERRLIYNYYLLGDRKSMFKVFRFLLEEPDVKEEDFSIALNTAIEEKEFSKGMIWANRGVEKFPKSDILLSFRGWLNRLRADNSHAVSDFEKALKLNPKNAIVSLNYGYIQKDAGRYSLAKDYFTTTIANDPNSIFADSAQKEIDAINALPEDVLNGSGNTLSDNTGSTMSASGNTLSSPQTQSGTSLTGSGR